MTIDLSAFESLDELGAIAATCRVCPLADGRTNVVFGAGSPESQVLIVGEAPGRQEDETGIPFVGRSGQLLVKLLAEIELAREDV